MSSVPEAGPQAQEGGADSPVAGSIAWAALAAARREFEGRSRTPAAAAAVGSGQLVAAPKVAAVGEFRLFGDGTAENPDAGILWGNGYSWTAQTCPNGGCNGGKGGWIGNGGNGYGGGNGGDASGFGNGGNGGAALVPGGRGGNGGNGGLLSGNGGNGGTGGNGLFLLTPISGGDGGNGGSVGFLSATGRGGDGGAGGKGASGVNGAGGADGGRGGNGGSGALIFGAGGNGGTGGTGGNGGNGDLTGFGGAGGRGGDGGTGGSGGFFGLSSGRGGAGGDGGSAGDRGAGADAVAYVTNFDDDTVSVLNTTTNRVTGRISVGNGPKSVAVSPDGTRVYVANFGGDPLNCQNTTPQGCSVSVIDTGTSAPTPGTIGTGSSGGAGGSGGAANPVVATIPVGDYPVAIAVNPLGTRVYVAGGIAGSVSVIDTGTNQVVARITVGSEEPEGVAVDASGARLYVVGNSTVTVIDTATNQEIGAEVSAGYSVFKSVVLTTFEGDLCPDSCDQFYIADSHNDDVRFGLQVPDFGPLLFNRGIDVGDAPAGLAINPAGTALYVANQGSDSVSLISTATNRVVATYRVGDGPSAVAVNGAGTRVYVTNRGDGTVSVINTVTNQVVASVAVGSGPSGVAVGPR